MQSLKKNKMAKTQIPEGWQSNLKTNPKGLSTMAKFMPHPCLSFMDEKDREAIKEMDPKIVQEPGHYYIMDKRKSTVISFFVRTCPDGFHKDVRKQMCVPLEGQSMKLLCTDKDPLINKNHVEMLKEHLKNVSKTTKADNI